MSINFFANNSPDFGIAGKYQEIMNRPKTKEEQEARLYGIVGDIAQQQKYAMSPEGMEALLKIGRKDALEKAKTGLMFNTLAKLPESIATAVNPFGGPVGAAMFYQGMSQIPQIYSNTLASFPEIRAPGASVQQYRYFN